MVFFNFVTEGGGSNFSKNGKKITQSLLLPNAIFYIPLIKMINFFTSLSLRYGETGNILPHPPPNGKFSTLRAKIDPKTQSFGTARRFCPNYVKFLTLCANFFPHIPPPLKMHPHLPSKLHLIFPLPTFLLPLGDKEKRALLIIFQCLKSVTLFLDPPY